MFKIKSSKILQDKNEINDHQNYHYDGVALNNNIFNSNRNRNKFLENEINRIKKEASKNSNGYETIVYNGIEY